ncbi:S-adenosylmethionine decarboxylase [Dyella tabacisoli]|uniref:S-adenosylmethionine decarboxylase proenzyme n=1 Tax=Dyella tabacisoli TaxID=2282381 RepID=A0A369UJM5_9GAMM|nr:S-adenosylmethionine decarboxylase [Dyella tabacisoli]RDD80726.1 hypothetical protein DVJ77_15965 [Dyella tabacisoli]
MNSTHFLGEWFDCGASINAMSDPAAIRALCVEHVMRHRLTIAYDFFTHSAHEGVIGALIAEDMHMVVRTFPARRAMNVDLYARQHRHSDIAMAFEVMDGLRDDFRPARSVLHRVQQGVESYPAGRVAVAPTQAFAGARWLAA